VLAGALLLLAPCVASASTSFPDVVKDEWQLPGAVPACTLCHQTLAGGFGTATKPFGRAVLMNGATAVDTGALRRALRALDAAGSDVDHDGMTDIAELQQGADPDSFDDYGVDAGAVGDTFDEYPIPQTGCSVAAVGRRGAHLLGSSALTGPRPSPTVGPTSGADSRSPARRISDDAFLVCGLILSAVFSRWRRLRVQRKRVASATR
ncbi:MAG: hypothetical protein ABW061_08750, partial [Polyangiaceae bacterium]